MYRATVLTHTWIKSGRCLDNAGSFRPVTALRFGNEVLAYVGALIMAAATFLLRTRGARAHLATLCLCLSMLIGFAGCQVFSSTPAQSAANQSLITHREALADARATYAATERLVVSLHRGGTITTERGRALTTELQTVVRPLIETAQDALLTGNFDAAILKATEAVANVLAKTKSPAVIVPARPSLFQLPPSAPPVERPEPVQASAIALGVGTALIELMQLYKRKKAEAVASGEGDDARIKELDKQIADLTAADDAADAEARAEFGLSDTAAPSAAFDDAAQRNSANLPGDAPKA